MLQLADHGVRIVVDERYLALAAICFGTDIDRLDRQALALGQMPEAIAHVEIVGDFDHGVTLGGSSTLCYLVKLSRRVGQMVHDPESPLTDRPRRHRASVIGLQQLLLDFRMVFEILFGDVQLLLAGFGQRNVVGVIFQQDAETAVATADVDSVFEVFTA